MDIQNCFPYDPSVWGEGKVVIITRDKNIENNTNINETIYVGELSPEEKLVLFTKIMIILLIRLQAPTWNFVSLDIFFLLLCCPYLGDVKY